MLSRPKVAAVALLCLLCVYIWKNRLISLEAAHPFESGATANVSQPNICGISVKSNDTEYQEQREEVLYDGVRRYTQSIGGSRPEILFLVLTADQLSWGWDSLQPTRTFNDFLVLIESTGLDQDHISLGIMTASEAEYGLYRQVIADKGLARVTILLKQSEKMEDRNLFTSIPRGGRHSSSYQNSRRSNIAKLRNELMLRSLQDEQHLVWIDADVKDLSPNIIQMMVRQSQGHTDAGIITALCEHPWFADYDKNAWFSQEPKLRSRTSATSTADLKKSDLVRLHVGELIKNTSDNDIIPLDSVGGTILYIRASLVHQGLMFPPYHVVGTRWSADGWDGLETEGLCYVARHLDGGGCYTLGGGHKVKHTRH